MKPTIEKQLNDLYWKLRKRKRTSINSRLVGESSGLIQIAYAVFIYRGKAVFFDSDARSPEYVRLSTMFLADRIESIPPHFIAPIVEWVRYKTLTSQLGMTTLRAIRGEIVLPRMKTLKRTNKSP